ncbi:MAG: UvrD-helicase domain-containing protein, partial [Clostridia bacterium]|nr:UvrD-helicase domain-containing protein [Clostridia bacterium]
YRVLREDQAEDAPSDVAKRYQAQYKEIFVDEYQDTNQIQESILKLVSGAWNGTPNIFMVGDVKQSVYGFRQACPDLFLEKYTHYRDVFEGQGDTNGKRICLYMNFRSRSAVLDTVNQIFRGIMHENTCGMEYTPAEYLNYGADYYDRVQLSETDPRPNPRTEIVLINHKDFADKRMPELHEVARRIETLIEEGYPVYDRQTNGLRPIRYSDICILLRSVKHTGKDFQDYFVSRNIPTLCPEEEDFFARPEVQVMLSFLKVLDNPSQDIPLLAVLRNVYGVTDSEFARIKLEVPGKDLSFWDRVQAYGQKNGGLLDRCVQRIHALRAESRDSTMGRLVWKCMHENNFFDALLAMPNGVVARQNLLLFMNRAVGYDTNINKGLYTFVNRMETLAKSTKNVPASGSVEDGLNAVRIMTIHGSKGLEFPVVFLCNTGSGRNKRDEGNKMLLHRSLGFGPTCYDRNKKLLFSSIMRLAVRQQKALDAKAEELRVLYVALTRAKEKLIITGSISKEANVYVEEKKQCCDLAKGMPMDYYVLHSDSFLSLMVMALCTHFSDSYKIQPAQFTEELDAFNSANVETSEVTFELPFVAPYQGLSGETETARTIAPAKVSVSQLGELERPSFYPETPARRSTEQDDTEGGARVGTLVHSALQRVDYARLSQNRDDMECYGEELLQTMVEDGFMTEAERALVPEQILVDYFTSDFALRLRHADWILREVPFTFLRPWKELSGEDLPGETAVQGVMDCVAQIEDKLVLIDFKSDRVSEDFEAYSKRYHTQISVYNEACLRAFGKAPDEVYLYYLRKHHPERILL